MSTTKELYALVLETLLQNQYFLGYKYKAKDKNFVKKRNYGFNAIEFQVHDSYDLKRDSRAMEVKPLYFVRFDVLHQWFEKYSFKTITDQRNSYIVIFNGVSFNRKEEYYFMLDENGFKKDLNEFVLDVTSNAQSCFPPLRKVF